MKKIVLMGLAAAVCAAMSHSASAVLLVYEPFDYTPDTILTGNGGALGTTGVWNSYDTISGDGKTQDWFLHQEGTTSGVGLSGANPSVEPLGMHRWDGTVANLATKGCYAGLWGADDWNDPDGPNSGEPGRNLSADIGLDPSVTASFQPGTTTWISYVSVRGWDRNEEQPNLVLGTIAAPDGSRGDNYGGIGTGGSGFGTGGGPTRNNRTDIYPMFYDTGQYHNMHGAIPNNSYGESSFEVSEADSMDWQELDPEGFFGPPNIVVMKLQWDADTNGEDIISVARFLQEDTISEANFDAMIAAQPNLSSANWDPANKPNIDQSQLDTITFMGIKYFVDEIRIATTFEEALPPPATATPGDFNVDGQVEQTDLNLLLVNWGSATVPAEWVAPFDGLVDQNELNDLLLNWGAGVGAEAVGGESAVPEPATLGLLLLGGLAIRRRR